MHELSIAGALMEQVVEQAEANHLKKVDEVELHVGVLKQVVPEMMQEAFREVRAGTVAADAVLVMKEIGAQAKCRQCEKRFEPQVDSFLCPVCKKADVEILKGNEILLMSLSGV